MLGTIPAAQPCRSSQSPPCPRGGTALGDTIPMHRVLLLMADALTATDQRCPILPWRSNTWGSSCSPSPLLILAAVSFSWHSAVCSDLVVSSPIRLQLAVVPVHLLGPSCPCHCIPAPCPAWCRLVLGQCLMSQHVHGAVTCVAPSTWSRVTQGGTIPIPLQGQGLPCSASHCRGQEVSGPITMGLCAVSVLLSTDLVQFCTVFSLLG